MSAITEPHYTVPELSKAWKLSVDTIRAMFEGEPGVFRIEHPELRNKRRYRVLRIPASVAERVYNKRVIGVAA